MTETEIETDDRALRRALSQNLTKLEDAISADCRAANRPRAEVELIAVSKNHPTEALIAAVELGLNLFGENRVQEFAAKSIELANAGVRSKMRAHLIGHLQSNKAAKAVEVFDAVDSVDSLKLAERLNEAAARLGKRLPILLEIKLSDEETKAGLSPESAEFAQLLERLPTLGNLDAEGMMTIAPLDVPQEETRGCFRALRELRDRISATHPRLNLPVLSMGMSGDFPLAIAEGATRIRVGTALFGTRPGYPL